MRDDFCMQENYSIVCGQCVTPLMCPSIGVVYPYNDASIARAFRWPMLIFPDVELRLTLGKTGRLLGRKRLSLVVTLVLYKNIR